MCSSRFERLWSFVLSAVYGPRKSHRPLWITLDLRFFVFGSPLWSLVVSIVLLTEARKLPLTLRGFSAGPGSKKCSYHGRGYRLGIVLFRTNQRRRKYL